MEKFEYLSALEGKKISSLNDIQNAKKHLWVDLIINEESFKFIWDNLAKTNPETRNEYEYYLRRAATWFYHYEPTLRRLGIHNEALKKNLEKIELLLFNRNEWRTYRRIFDKGVFR